MDTAKQKCVHLTRFFACLSLASQFKCCKRTQFIASKLMTHFPPIYSQFHFITSIRSILTRWNGNKKNRLPIRSYPLSHTLQTTFFALIVFCFMEQVLSFVCCSQMKIKCDEWFEFVIKLKSFFFRMKSRMIFIFLANVRDDFDKFNASLALSMGV